MPKCGGVGVGVGGTGKGLGIRNADDLGGLSLPPPETIEEIDFSCGL